MAKKIQAEKEKKKIIPAKDIRKERKKEEKKPTNKKDNKKNTNDKKHQRQQKKKNSFDDNELLEDDEQVISTEELQKKYEAAITEAKEKIIPLINSSQVKSAIESLSKLIKDKYKGTTNLLADINEEFFYLNFCFDKLPVRCSIRPVMIPTINSIYGKEFNTTVCLIVKDSKSDFKDLNIDLPFKLKVIDISKLKLKYERFEQRRNLLKQFDLFLCDSRVYFLLRKLLGKPFYQAKKFPIAINLDYEHPEVVKERIISYVNQSTVFHMTHGPNYTIKFSRVAMKIKDSVANAIEVITNTIPHILKWEISSEELTSITIKGTNTVELPIYNHLKEDEIMAYLNDEEKKKK